MHDLRLNQSRERTVAKGAGKSAIYAPPKSDHGALAAWKMLQALTFNGSACSFRRAAMWDTPELLATAPTYPGLFRP